MNKNKTYVIETTNKTQKRNFSCDVIRFMAIIAVVMLHCGADLVIKFHPPSQLFTVGNFFDSISRFGVPIFLMLSGFFMLDEDREIPIEKFVYKIKHLFFILIAWSTFYALVYHFNKFFYFFFFGHFHLWYLYTIIGLYAITPILRLFVNIKNKSYIYYFLILTIIFNFAPPFIDFIFHHTELLKKFMRMFQINMVTGLIGYYLLGWILNKDWAAINKYKNFLYLLGIISVVGIFLGTELYTSHYSNTYKILYENSNLPVFLYSISLFVLIKNIVTKRENKIPNNVKTFISKLAQLSFGVYLIHPSFLELTRSIIKHHLTFSNNQYPFLYISLEFFMTITMSFIAVYILSKIKYLNKLIKI